jgi:hypothetical protein
MVLALPLVWVEVGACGRRLVCLLLTRTGLDRLVGASYGPQQPGNRQGEEASVRYRHEASARWAQARPTPELTWATDATCTGGRCLGALAPKRHDLVLEHTAHGRDHATGPALREKALAGWPGQGMPSTREAAPGGLAAG